MKRCLSLALTMAIVAMAAGQFIGCAEGVAVYRMGSLPDHAVYLGQITMATRRNSFILRPTKRLEAMVRRARRRYPGVTMVGIDPDYRTAAVYTQPVTK